MLDEQMESLELKPFQKGMPDSEVLALWRSDRDKGGPTSGRAARIALAAGLTERTIFRALKRLGLAGKGKAGANLDHTLANQRRPSFNAAREMTRQSPAASIAQSVITASVSAGVSVRDAVAGLVLADVLTTQRAEVQRISQTAALLSQQLSSFVEPFVAPDVNGLQQLMHEDQLGKAVAILDKLAATTAKVHEMQRDSWGITKDSMNPTHSDVMAQLTAEMERRRAPPPTPHPVEHPPVSVDLESQQTS